MIEATVVEYKTKRRKQAKIEIMNVLIEQEDKGSRIEGIPFLYTCFPAMIYYNKTVLIGQRINIDYVGLYEYKIYAQNELQLEKNFQSFLCHNQTKVFLI